MAAGGVVKNLAHGPDGGKTQAEQFKNVFLFNGGRALTWRRGTGSLSTGSAPSRPSNPADDRQYEGTVPTNAATRDQSLYSV